MDWLRFDASGGRVRKLSVTDTGTGMTAEQLHRYINQLASSGREQSADGNFGVGAKVAAGSRNPHGLEYRSWHQGQGALVCFKRHPDGRWGLAPQRRPDGHTDYWRALSEADKPWLLRGQDHGTQVVLLGEHERHDTTQAPASVSDARRHWISRYLNARFLRLPAKIEILVREQRDRQERGQLEPVHGEQHHLERHAHAAGVVELSDALAYWWVLNDDHRARRRQAAIWASTGHAAAVYGDELYNTLPQTRGGYGRQQDFGIRFAYERVVLHLHPQVHTGRLACNTARTLLLLDHEPLPWARWGEELTAATPDEIRHSRNAPPPPTASHASRRSASASARSCRSTVSVGTAPHNRRGNPLPGPAWMAPAMGLPIGSRRTTPRRPQGRCTHTPTRSRAATGPGASPRQAAPTAPPLLTRRWICPMWRGSPRATAPERRGTLRTRLPATTRAATS